MLIKVLLVGGVGDSFDIKYGKMIDWWKLGWW